MERLLPLVTLVFGWLVRDAEAIACERTDQRAFIRTVNARATDPVDELLRSTDKKTCLDKCLKSSTCVSFVFWSLLNECEIRTKIKPEGTSLAAQSDADHYQKTCIKAASGVCLNGFARYHQKALIGFANSELSPVGLDQCLAACLDSDACLSVQYFYQSEECVLNSQNMNGRPEMFVDITDERSDYFEPQCTGVWASWTEWTPCLSDYQIRRRTCPIDGGCAGPATEVQNCDPATGVEGGFAEPEPEPQPPTYHR